MELIYLDIAVFVFINLFEAVLKCEASLQEHLDQVVKDLVLSILQLALLVELS